MSASSRCCHGGIKLAFAPVVVALLAVALTATMGSSAAQKDPPLGKTQLQGKGPPKKDDSLIILDGTGNPLIKKDKKTGKEEDLGLKDDKKDLKGTKILAWCASPRDMNVWLGPHNPQWKALEKKGFKIFRMSGPFPRKFLDSADELWVYSTPLADAYDSVVDANSARLMALKTIPMLGEKVADWQATLLEYTKHKTRAQAEAPKLSRDDLDAIENFVVKEKKGLFVLADNDPYTLEADQIVKHLFKSSISGNYPGQRTAYVRQRKLTPQQIQKFGGQKPFAIDDHALLTDVNFLWEGITISHFKETPTLKAIVYSSNEKTREPLIGVSTIPGTRVVVDCGYTRYWAGMTPNLHLITKTAGTLRFVENVAAYLAGAGEQ